MSIADELQAIDGVLAELEFKIRDDGALGSFVEAQDSATLKRLRLEAKTLLDDALGVTNNFSMSLHFSPVSGSPLDHVQGTRAVVQGAVNHLHRGGSPPLGHVQTAKAQFVNASRIAALRSVKSQWDLTRLVRLCEELNLAYQNDCFMSVAMLGRAIMDHVPPIFGHRTFADVANQYSGESSLRKSLQSLQLSLRNIADAHLHIPIRQKEVLPTAQQVDFHKDLDVLLGEVIRVLK